MLVREPGRVGILACMYCLRPSGSSAKCLEREWYKARLLFAVQIARYWPLGLKAAAVMGPLSCKIQKDFTMCMANLKVQLKGAQAWTLHFYCNWRHGRTWNLNMIWFWDSGKYLWGVSCATIVQRRHSLIISHGMRIVGVKPTMEILIAPKFDKLFKSSIWISCALWTATKSALVCAIRDTMVCATWLAAEFETFLLKCGAFSSATCE